MHLSCYLRYLGLVLACAASFSTQAQSFEQKLDEADRVRSSDPARFRTLLKELDASSMQAKTLHKERLRYLLAYHAIVYEDQFEKGIALAKGIFERTVDDDLKFRAGSLVVNSYAVNRDFAEGLRFLNQTLPLRNRVRDKDIRHDGINVAAVLYNQIGQYKLGLRYAEETLADNPNPRARCYAGYFQLEAQYFLTKLPADDAPINQVLSQCTVLGERIITNLARAVLARKWAEQGENRKAIALLETNLADVEATGYARLKAEIHSLLAELKLFEGDITSAREHAQATIAMGESNSSSLPLVVAYKTLYQISDRQGDGSAAFDYFRRYAEADKAHLTDVRARELAYEIVRHETLQKNQEIELLNQQNRVLQLQQQVDRQSAANTRLLMLVLLALSGLILYWAYRVKRMEHTLRHRAEVDALTGVNNRQHFTARAEKTLLDCGRAGEEVVLIMFDLDHFKSINDRFGHRAGDWVLQRVAETCRELCREVDCLGRIGGEEFAFLLRGQDVRSAIRLADDCRMRLAAIDTGETGFSFPVTASFGVTSTALSGYGLASLFSHADKALYAAKHEGRNRVCVYLPDDVPWQPATLPSVAEPTAQPEPAATGAGQDTPPDGQPTPAAGVPHLRVVPK